MKAESESSKSSSPVSESLKKDCEKYVAGIML